MPNFYFTSDLHLGHTNIAGPKVSKWKNGFRTFDSVSQMDDYLINKINLTVGEDDYLFHAGDFSFKGGKPEKYRERIVCKNIIMIDGNHDRFDSKLRDNFSFIPLTKSHLVNNILVKPSISITVFINKTQIFISHYKHLIWEASHRGAWHLYGHSHSTAEHNQNGKSMDIGVDNAKKLLGDYRPFSFDEIKSIMDKREIPTNLDRH